ncbi:helix-turn-helix transcriptional regulator [Levilactobacillus brevis]|uniref:helix-turn-helix transcriptional regulator n=1 Tax=Levilactobacillus brevis TaxID=1580 RepID=UPI001BAC0CB0|nr:AraC family transcriptional regulator [Levilactobacillus brevis]MBS1006695.1 helix-turn-helix transcriptional regulator [Levilactobacillus brevis]MBS1013829.1 helix-turn-helix transcriptional regulator [Levilactobacillus brevis]
MHTIEEILKDMAQRVYHLRNVHLSANCRYIYQLILDAPETKLTIPQISNQLGLSPHHLSTLFKREVGVSITRFKLLVRINHAVQLINTTNLPLSEIAAALNFADQSHLTREFKTFVGVSPSADRKNPHLTATWNLYNFLTINLG